MARRTTYLLFVFLLLVAGQAWAGVVEDAEEELKKLGRGQQQVVVSGTTNNSSDYQSRRANARTRTSRTTNEKSTVGRGRNTGAESSGSTGTASGQEPPEMETRNLRVKKDSEMKQKGRLVSLGVILFFGLLIFLATVASRRLGNTE